METRDQTGILWTTLVVLLTSYLSCAGSAQTLKPLSTDADMQVSKRVFPLATAYERVKQQLDAMARTGAVPLMTFT